MINNKIIQIVFFCVSSFLVSNFSHAAKKDTDKKETAAKEEKKTEENVTKTPNFEGISTEEIRIYQEGEIRNGELVAGGLLGTFFGFGLGHIVYGQYGERGWIFTVSELGSYAVMAIGMAKATTSCLFSNSDDCGDGFGMMYFGAIAYLGLRIWEIVDVWTIPSKHNNKYRAIKTKIDSQSMELESFNLLPVVADNQGLHNGMSLNLSFKF